jgi:hypothetical protein
MYKSSLNDPIARYGGKTKFFESAYLYITTTTSLLVVENTQLGAWRQNEA